MLAYAREYLLNMVALVRTRTAADSMVVVSGNMTSAMLRFVTMLLLYRVLSESNYGTLAIFIGVMDVVAMLCDLGLNTTLVRFVSVNEDKKSWPIVRKALTIKCALMVIIALGTAILFRKFVAVQHVLPEDKWLYWAALTAGLLLSAHGLTMAITQAHRRYGHYAILSATINALRFAIIGTMILIGVKQTNTLCATFFAMPAIAIIVGIGLSMVSMTTRECVEKPSTNYGEILQFMLPLAILQAVIIATVRVNTFMLGSLSIRDEVARYDLAYQVAFIFPLIARALFAVLLPKVTAMKTSSELGDFRRRCISLYPLVIVAAVAGMFILPFLLSFSDKYAQASQIVRVIVLCFGIHVITNLLGLIFYAIGRPHYMTIIYFAQLVCIVLLNFVLIPKYGGLGAALSLLFVTVPSVIALIVWTDIVIKQKRQKETDYA